MKYAEITIIKEQKETSFFDYFTNEIPESNRFTDKDTIIVLFDDNSIFEVIDIPYNNLFKFGIKGRIRNYPIYFKYNENMFFFEEYNKNSENIFDSTDIFKENAKIMTTPKMCQSNHNVIYYTVTYNPTTKINRTDVFSIMKIQSNKDKPRYLLAYDETYFDNGTILYLVDCIFRYKFVYSKL